MGRLGPSYSNTKELHMNRAVAGTANLTVALTTLLMVAMTPATGQGARAVTDPQVEYVSDLLGKRVIFLTQGWGELGIDTCVRPTGRAPSPMRIKDITYTKGLGHHASGEIVIDLTGEYRLFEAQVGVQWQKGTTGTVVFQVFVDGEKRFDSGVRREQDDPLPVAVAVGGADELRLVSTDAGDGITCDCANWANARLTRDPGAAARSEATLLDAAPFARVVTSDPARMDGCRSSRIQEFTQDDLHLDRPVRPAEDGSYLVTPDAAGAGAIGLEWIERRLLSRLDMRLAPGSLPPKAEVGLQYWSGESRWQGKWLPVVGDVTREGDTVSLRPDWGTEPGHLSRGTEKVRWVFTAMGGPVAVHQMRALTRSRCDEVRLVARVDPDTPGGIGIVEAYNGHLLHDDGPDASLTREWDTTAPLKLRVRYARSRSLKHDRTVLRFRLPQGAFAVALEDVLSRSVVYLPHCGFTLSLDDPTADPARYVKQLQGRYSVLDRVRSMPDQTFSQAMDKVHEEIQDNGPTMLSLACDNHKFVVDRDGTFGPYKSGRAHPSYVFSMSPTYGSEGQVLAGRHLVGDWLPVPRVTGDADGVTYSLTTFVTPYGDAAPSDVSPWWHPRPLFIAELECTNTLDEPTTATVCLQLAIGDGIKAPLLAPLGEGIALTDGGRLLAFVGGEAGQPVGAAIEGHRLTLTRRLPARERTLWRVYLPGWQAAAEEAADLLPHPPTFEDTKAYWQGILSGAMQVDVPDKLLANVIRASQVYCLMNARNQEQGAQLEPWIGADRYGPLESEGHAIILGMDLFGHHDFARRCLDFYVKRYRPEGYLTTGYTMMGTGQHLWTLADHCGLTQDDAWLRQNADKIAGAAEWIARQCGKTRSNADEEPSPEDGLVPPGVIADWGRFAYRFYMEAHYCAGLGAAARALDKIGHPKAGELAGEARQFRRDLEKAYRWSQARTPALPLSDGTFIPGVPSMVYCLGKCEEIFAGEDWGRSWAGDAETGPHHLAALGILDPAGEDAQWMAQILEDYWFLRTGRGAYPGDESRKEPFDLGGFAKIQPYYGRLTTIYAQRDEVAPFIRAYFNAIPSLLNTENLSLWEHFHNGGGWNKTHETGWLLEQTRTMLVTRRGEELWLAPFVTGNWLRDGMRVSVKSAPTYFGPVGYEIRSRADSGVIEATVRGPVRSAPRELVLRLRHPEGKRIRSVTVNGRAHDRFDADRNCVLLPTGQDRLEVRANY